MTHSLFSRVATVSVAVSVLLVGCGGSGASTVVDAVTGPPTPLRMLPADSAVVAHGNVASLLQSPYIGTIRDAVSAFAQEQETDLGAYLALADHTQTAAVGLKPDGSAAAWVLVLRGDYTEDHLGLVARGGGTSMLREHRLHGVGSDAVGVLLDGSTIVVGNEPEVRAAVDRYDGLAPATGPQLNGYAEAAGRARMGQHDISMTYVVTDEIRDRFQREDPESLLARNALTFGGSLSMQHGLQVTGFVTTNSEAAAVEVGAYLREFARVLSDDNTMAMLGVSAILSQIEVAENANDVNVALRLDDAEFRSVLDRIRPLLALLGAA